MTSKNNVDGEDGAKLIDSESAGRIGRGRGVNHFAALSRARRLSHDIVSRTASTQRGPSDPRDSREKKAVGRRERRKRVVGAFCGFGNVGNGTTKGSPPCLTTFRFSFHGLYTSGALVKPSRPAVSLAPSSPSIALLGRWFTVAYAPRCFHSLPLSLSRGRNSREKPLPSLPPRPAGPRWSLPFF